MREDINKIFDNLLNLFNFYLESRKDKEIDRELRSNSSMVKPQKVKRGRKKKNCRICINDSSSSVE